MIAAMDVCYNETEETARAAAVLFLTFTDEKAVAEYITTIHQSNPYIPGQFFRRELPCLLKILSETKEPIDTLIIDGYVQLNEKPGLGMYLWNALDHKVTIIGVAKSKFRDVQAVEVFRANSTRPLYVTAIGMKPETAARFISRMAGNYRIPTLLKRADQLSKCL